MQACKTLIFINIRLTNTFFLLLGSQITSFLYLEAYKSLVFFDFRLIKPLFSLLFV